MVKSITVQTIIKAPLAAVWDCWNKPEHITCWAFASDDWEAPSAENDLRIGGKFKTRMQAKDGSAGFDFIGTYSKVEPHSIIEYDMERAPKEEKSRHVTVGFMETPEGVRVTEIFDPESENPEEMQRAGWQTILDNFKKYVEGLNKKN